ncbi:MAG TPA: phospholipid carrier-dependent glycosyltransferase [Steroidobacteraceae bacterium]|nr:phospholipid carrier-dependent glycosyltransferase [Steroidobacteraceae bacterium]
MTETQPATVARATPAARIALAVITLGACVLVASTWHVFFATWDEPEHLAAGVELLDRGYYEYDTEHPPIARVVLALGPWLAGAHSFGTPPPSGVTEGEDILYRDGKYDLYLTLARAGALPFLALLLLVTWLWARRMLAGEGAALLAVVLLLSVPPVLGHAGVAALDVAAAATILLALYTLDRWLDTPSWRTAALFGLASGLAVGTKFSAVPYIGMSLMALGLTHWVLGLRTPPAAPAATAAKRAGELVLVALAALVPLFLAYGIRAPNEARVAARFNWAVSYLLQQPGTVDHGFGVLLTHLSLPRELEDLVNGIVAVKAHNDGGHLSYLFGQVRMTGWWYFYLVALAVKTPLPLLASGSLGVGWLAREGWRSGDNWRITPALLILAILLFASSFSRINIGIRHVLILYPLLAIGAAWAVTRTWQGLRRWPNRRLAAAGAVALAALLTWQLSTLWTAWPDYLAWFNETVSHPERVLVDSDLDWGQDLRRLEKRAAELRIARLSLAYRGTADLNREPLPPFVILPPRSPTTGWVAVSQLARTRNLADYAWLNAYQPVEHIGKTIDLYYIP